MNSMYSDVVFYVMDVVILVMLVKMLRVSRKVELVIDPGLRWLIPTIFIGIALISMWRFTGTFRWIQGIALLLMGVLYWFMKSGLTPTSIVMVGREVPYDKASPIFIEESEHSLHFRMKGTSVLYFPETQTEEIRTYLQKQNVHLAKKMANGTTIQHGEIKKKF